MLEVSPTQRLLAARRALASPPLSTALLPTASAAMTVVAPSTAELPTAAPLSSV